jgi:hypothetical protein
MKPAFLAVEFAPRIYWRSLLLAVAVGLCVQRNITYVDYGVIVVDGIAVKTVMRTGQRPLLLRLFCQRPL